MERRGGPARWAVAALAALVLIGSAGTWAYWTDSATVAGGELKSGTMDLQVEALTAIQVDDLTPGESVAFQIEMTNAGTPPIDWTASVARGATPAWTYEDSPLEVHLSPGVAGNGATYPRVGQCDGAAPSTAWVDLAAESSLLATSSTSLAPGLGDPLELCLVVRMKSTAADINQGKTGALTLVFDADQATQ